ncbi:MAG: hypothetical protein WBA97_05930 [Actinophytocola sp.]|uniref:hypothetical protein n=1 Tax=Actinophytocola sp. TaxID=1872138 RepID=UPI003C788E3F
MDAEDAISLVVEWIRTHRIDYPTEGLAADRFEAGWSVYAPVAVDESDPMAFLDMPVGRSVFLVGDSGRIKEVTSSVPPPQARKEFIEEERAAESRHWVEFERGFRAAAAQDPAVFPDVTFHTPAHEAQIAAEASRLLDPIVRELAMHGVPGWERFDAAFAFTVSAEIAQLRFRTLDGRSGLVPVPNSIATLVRAQREVAAQMPDGPWWRLLLTVTNSGEMTVSYDYGDDPFPDDQLLSAEHYRNDLARYPRRRTPVWLAGYVAGPAAQGRDPHRAAVSAAADAAEGRAATPCRDLPSLHDLWVRWAVISAAYAGVGSEWGPRIRPGYAWYENDHRSGSTLYWLPGERAVLSGGRWDSVLLANAYNGPGPMPDLYGGAPAWVNDSVINTRNNNGLVSFCFWWAGDRWSRGGTDTSGELDAPLPPVRTVEDTVAAMTSHVGPDRAAQCGALLNAATSRKVNPDDVAALFPTQPRVNVDMAIDQLSLAGLLAT